MLQFDAQSSSGEHAHTHKSTAAVEELHKQMLAMQNEIKRFANEGIAAVEKKLATLNPPDPTPNSLSYPNYSTPPIGGAPHISTSGAWGVHTSPLQSTFAKIEDKTKIIAEQIANLEKKMWLLLFASGAMLISLPIIGIICWFYTSTKPTILPPKTTSARVHRPEVLNADATNLPISSDTVSTHGSQVLTSSITTIQQQSELGVSPHLPQMAIIPPAKPAETTPNQNIAKPNYSSVIKAWDAVTEGAWEKVKPWFSGIVAAKGLCVDKGAKLLNTPSDSPAVGNVGGTPTPPIGSYAWQDKTAQCLRMTNRIGDCLTSPTKQISDRQTYRIVNYLIDPNTALNLKEIMSSTFQIVFQYIVIVKCNADGLGDSCNSKIAAEITMDGEPKFGAPQNPISLKMLNFLHKLLPLPLQYSVREPKLPNRTISTPVPDDLMQAVVAYHILEVDFAHFASNRISCQF